MNSQANLSKIEIMKHLSIISPEQLTEKLSVFLARRGLLDQVSKSMLFVTDLSKTRRVTLEMLTNLICIGQKIWI